MKDAVLTIRLPKATRRRIEALAAREGRSLSAQVERLIEASLNRAAEPHAAYGAPVPSARARSLAGALAGGRIATLTDFRTVRRELGSSLGRHHEDRRR